MMEDNKELANKVQPGELATFSGSFIEEDGRRPSERSDDIGLSRLVFYAGTQSDKKKYGVQDDGSFLDGMELTNFGLTVRVAYVGLVGFTYAKWVEGQATPVYSVDSWNKLTAAQREDFKWVDDKKPTGTETVSIVVLLLDADSQPVGPYLLNLKRTSLPVWDKCIKPQENAAAMKGDANIFELSSEDDKNAAKQDYKRMTARLVCRVKPDNPLHSPLMALRAGFAALKDKAKKMNDDDDNAGGDHIPV